MLEGIRAHADPEALLARVAAWEREHALAARPAPGAAALVSRLAAEGRALGVLTRNSRAAALLTLEAIGLSAFFRPDCVLGRDEAAPKPAPDGVLALLARWGADPSDVVMVGDYRHDVNAGRAAGVRTVLVDATGELAPWHHEAHQVVRSLEEL